MHLLHIPINEKNRENTGERTDCSHNFDTENIKKNTEKKNRVELSAAINKHKQKNKEKNIGSELKVATNNFDHVRARNALKHTRRKSGRMPTTTKPARPEQISRPSTRTEIALHTSIRNTNTTTPRTISFDPHLVEVYTTACPHYPLRTGPHYPPRPPTWADSDWIQPKQRKATATGQRLCWNHATDPSPTGSPLFLGYGMNLATVIDNAITTSSTIAIPPPGPKKKRKKKKKKQ